MTDKTSRGSSTDTIRDILVKQRVTISLFVFSALIVKDFVTGMRPHDTGNFHDPAAVTGMVAVLVGLAIRSWAAGVINKSKVLATTGPYRLCRHPLYLGSLLMMFGFCVLVGSVLDVCICFGPVLGIYMLTMQREERRLAERHGAAWSAYVAVAPQFFPYRLAIDLRSDWSLAQWLNNREYKAAITASSALMLLHMWRLV